jgi:hypothetical protein
VSRRQEWSQSPLALALRGSDSDFTVIDSIKSGTAAQTKPTRQRTVLKLFDYISSISNLRYANFDMEVVERSSSALRS